MPSAAAWIRSSSAQRQRCNVAIFCPRVSRTSATSQTIYLIIDDLADVDDEPLGLGRALQQPGCATTYDEPAAEFFNGGGPELPVLLVRLGIGDLNFSDDLALRHFVLPVEAQIVSAPQLSSTTLSAGSAIADRTRLRIKYGEYE